mmetsp:Transcript_5440/g.13673  ORF Transcript_5440/g.13673 Transcript_5440/m.13673 type:complete len:133 (-) Transcript_5440:1318-1716(-)
MEYFSNIFKGLYFFNRFDQIASYGFKPSTKTVICAIPLFLQNLTIQILFLFLPIRVVQFMQILSDRLIRFPNVFFFPQQPFCNYIVPIFSKISVKVQDGSILLKLRSLIFVEGIRCSKIAVSILHKVIYWSQ